MVAVSGGGSSPAPVVTGQSDRAVLLIGAVVGFFLIPPMARSQPTLVNGFLLLVLFSTLLIRRDRWLPYLDQLSAVGATK
jgi:hypothetical protein